MIKLKTLKTKKQKEAVQKRNKTIMGLFIAIIMVSSIAGYAIWNQQSGTADEQQEQEYQGHIFIKNSDSGKWQTQIEADSKTIILNSVHLPHELENITANGNPLLEDFKNKIIYIIANSEAERQGASLFAQYLNQFAIRMQIACSEENTESQFCTENNLPIKSCENADSSTSIIIINEDEEETGINYNNNCLIIKSNSSNINKVCEKTLFMIFGILS